MLIGGMNEAFKNRSKRRTRKMRKVERRKEGDATTSGRAQNFNN